MARSGLCGHRRTAAGLGRGAARQRGSKHAIAGRRPPHIGPAVTPSADTYTHGNAQNNHIKNTSASTLVPRITAGRCPLCTRAPAAADSDRYLPLTPSCTSLLLSIDGTDRRTDTVPLPTLSVRSGQRQKAI